MSPSSSSVTSLPPRCSTLASHIARWLTSSATARARSDFTTTVEQTSASAKPSTRSRSSPCTSRLDACSRSTARSRSGIREPSSRRPWSEAERHRRHGEARLNTARATSDVEPVLRRHHGPHMRHRRPRRRKPRRLMRGPSPGGSRPRNLPTMPTPGRRGNRVRRGTPASARRVLRLLAINPVTDHQTRAVGVLAGREQGAGFVSGTESFDTSDPEGEAMVQITMVFAQLERARSSQRAVAWHAHRARRGDPTSAGCRSGTSAPATTTAARSDRWRSTPARRRWCARLR